MINSPASSSRGNESETSMEEGEVSGLQGMELAGGASFEIPTTSNPSTSNPSASNPINLLSLIERNKRKRYGEDDLCVSKMSPSYHDPDFTLTHKKWRSMLNDKFRLLNDELLSDFAEKLKRCPNGSFEEKQSFFFKVSGNLGTHPLVEIKTLIDRYIDRHIESEVFAHAMEETGYHTSNGGGNYAEIKNIIAAKLERIMQNKSIASRMRAYVRREFNTFLKEKYLRFIDRDFGQNTDIKADTLSKFSDLYHTHLKEKMGHVTYESMRAFDDIVAPGNDNPLSLSFIFTSFLGTMVFNDNAEKLSDLVTNRTNTLVSVLKQFLYKEQPGTIKRIRAPNKRGMLSEIKLKTKIEVFSANGLSYSRELKELIENSQAYLKAEIETFLLVNKVIALHGETNDVVVLCGSQLNLREQEVRDKIISSSLRYLRGELNECIKVN
ncbi:hypothetical protein [Candidatus Ichthyocystis sparus]|uniref:hypothetical protein n=1 Tax=Candidatus Ichthyocystis sparus TaxID=1561004 RepID=UPI000B839AE8|nr:hypothetical protein [Candidatus Ichthyocystis sparus]